MHLLNGFDIRTGGNGLLFGQWRNSYGTLRLILSRGGLYLPGVSRIGWDATRTHNALHDRAFIWYSGDETPDCIGCANWDTPEFFVGPPAEFVDPFLPNNRSSAHINEVGFQTEIMRTATWNSDHPNLVMCGITDNSTSNMRYVKGKAKRGAGLQLAHTFHRWLIAQRFRKYSFYCRSARNVDADFLSRSSPAEIAQWATDRNMIRIDPRARRAHFCGPTLPPWP